MLFTGLQRHTIGLFATCVDRNTDDAAGDRALVVITGSKVSSMRAAHAHGHAKALSIANDHIGAQFTR